MNDITALTQRELFEAWAHSQKMRLAYGDCGYVFSSTEMAWRAWRASSTELVAALEARDKQIADKNLELFKQSADIAELALSRKNAWKQASAARNGFDEQYALRDGAEKRIAELESRTVKLPAERFCPAEYAGSQLWSETEVWNKAITACADALRADGIKVEVE